MKTTKKALSVLLAVLMIMSSMSVCFGSISFAATSETSEFIEAVQCDAMKNFSATGSYSNNVYTFTTTAKNYTQFLELINVIKKFDNAVQSTNEYQNKHDHITNTNCSASSTQCTDFGALRTALVNDIGTSTYNTLDSTYNLGKFLDCVLNMEKVTYARSKNNYHKTTGWSYTAAAPEVYQNVLNVSVDYLSYFTSKTDTDELTDDQIYTTYKYTTAMGRQLYTTSASWGRKNYFGHSCVNTQQLGYFSKHEEGTKQNTNRASLQAMKTQLVTYKDYLDETTIAGVHKISTSSATLNAVAKALEDAYNEVGSKHGTNAATLFNHFFKTNYISHGTTFTNLVALIKKAATIAGYKSSCETIAKDYNIYTDETYKTYTSTEVNALYNEFKTAYEGYKAADDTMEAEIATYYGIDDYIADIPGVLADLLAYYYEIFLGSIKDRAYGDSNKGYISEYSSWTVEDIDNDVITSADILTALNEVNLDIDTLDADATDDDIQDYFGMSKDELIGILTTVKTHLETLGKYAGLNDDLYAQYATFTNNIANVINANSSKLYSVLSGYEAWHQNLQTFFTTWAAEVGEYKDLLEDDLQATMNTYMQEAYAALKARVVTQIDNAYGLYEVYYDMYGNNVTMASLTYFNTLKKAIDVIEHNAYNWMKSAHWTYGEEIDADSIAKYDALQVIYNAYGTFVANRGFDKYTQTTVETVREDTDKDIARENVDTDNDGIGEYEVADEDIEAIIDLLEAVLKDENITKLLGDLVNKDEDGNPTGEPFDLAELINGLLEDNLYTDNLVNTIISFLYPIVAQAFLDVWVGIDPIIDTTAETDMGTLPVHAKLKLYDVDTAIEAAGVALAPRNLGNFMAKNATFAAKYPTIITQLQAVTAQTRYAADGSYSDPWKDASLYEDATDEDGNVIIDEETGKAKQVMALDWGIDEAEDKRAAFIDAACAALCGLEPLLKALLLNQKFVSPNIENNTQRGGKIGTSVPGTTVEAFGLTLDLTLDPITLMLDMSANDGYDNVLAPLFELLGLTNIPHGESMTGIRDLLEDGLFAMIDQLIAKIDANPIKTILDVVPNLVYALEADLIAPVLNFLETNIYYEADTHYSANAYFTNVTGDLSGVMKADEPAYINVGEMLDLESLGLNLSDGLAGILEMLNINIPTPDVSVLATAGELVWKDTNRSRWTYSYQPTGISGKAAHIEANRADVLEYLLKYALDNLPELLAAFKVDTSTMAELVQTILTNVSNNADASVAAVVELFNQKIYNTLENYEWFDASTYVTGTVEGFTPATQIYMNPGNDWTEEKAEYLYENLDTLVTAVLETAKLDLNKETEELETIEEVFADLINGLFTNKTVTALAKLLSKLDLNALLAGEDGEEAAVDANGLVKNLLDIDLSVYSKYAELAEDEVVDFGVTDAETFVDALVELLAPLKGVLDFILAGGNIEITFAKGTDDEEKVTLLGYNGYNNAIIPLLEALGCDVKTLNAGDNALEVILDTLVAKINALTINTEENAKDGVIYGIIDMIPGIIYFLSSDGLTTTVRNLLQPVYVILDIIRPIYDVDLDTLLANIEVKGKPLGLDLDNINTEFVIGLICKLTGLNLTGLNTVIYDVCKVIGVTYTSVSTLEGQKEWKKGALNENFDGADLLTVVLSYLLEWITVDENAQALDEMLGTDGIVASIKSVFADVEIKYGTPDWMYWFETEEEFNSYVNGSVTLPNTLLALEYPNDWSDEAAEYISDNLAELVDMVIGLIEIEGVKYESLAALLDAKVNVFTTENLQKLVDFITGLLEKIDENLIDAAGRLLDANIVGLKSYTAPEGIDTTAEFATELANVLTTYAGGLVNWLFFGDDYRFAKKSDNTDTIVINGGLGYKKGLVLVLEALGCDLPAEATVETVLASLAARIDEILASPVNEVIDILPNLVYFLNADGVTVVVDNILQPVYALLTKLEALGINLDLTELLGFDLKYLSLEDILNLVTDKTGLNLEPAEEILVDLCIGKIEKGTHIYKMTADKKDTTTVVLTTALLLVSDEEFAAKLDELLGTEIIAAIKTVFESAPVSYVTPNWDYCWDTEDVDYVNGTIGVIESALTYPNDWTEEKAKYLADNLSALVDKVIALIEIDGVKYESLSALIDSKVDIYTADTLSAIQKALNDLIGGLDEDLKELVNVALGAADCLLGADVNALVSYDVTNVNDKESFINALTGMIMEVEGLVDWLLLGEDYELFVDDDGDMVYEAGEAIITLTGGHGYAEGLALLLEALGCKNLPDVYDAETINTEATVKAVVTSLANRIDEILANPVDEVIDLLPNLIYFLNTNGVAAVVDNIIGAINDLLIKLEGVGVELDINKLVNLKKILKIEDTDATISLDNLAMKDILQAASLMTGLDLTVLEGTLVGFALGEIKEYDSVSRTDVTFKMYYDDEFAKYDMLTVIVTAALLVVEAEGNEEKLNEMLDSDIITAVKNVFAGGVVEYSTPDWTYPLADNGTVDTMNYAITYPNNWTEETAKYVTEQLPEVGDIIAGLVDSNYTTLSALLKDKVNVFTSETLQKLIDLIADLLKDIDEELLGVGLLLDADIIGLKNHQVPAGITTVDEFAAELANILNTYASGVIEWLLLGQDYKFFVNDENGDAGYDYGEDIITITGAHGYAEGLALLLEALGCENLPEVYGVENLDTKAIVEAVFASLAARINEIFDNPVEEVLDLLPNLFYFLNTNGAAAVVDNMTAAITALLGKLEAFGVELDINELVNLKKLMKIEDTDATISLDNLAMADILQAVSYMTGFDITYIEDVLVGFAIGQVSEYNSVSANAAYKMSYASEADKYNLVTVIATLAIITLADDDNTDFVKELLGEDIYLVIINLLDMTEVEIQEFSWKLTEKADTGYVFSALSTSELYAGHEYGPLYTEEMAQYIADNFGEFVDNIVYLLGIQINGKNVDSLKALINGLLDGSLYNRSNVIAIRDALAGVIAKIDDLQVNGIKVGGHIKAILKTAGIADLDAVANVNVPEFTEDRAKFTEYLCDVLEPLYSVLKWLLANEDISFFIDENKTDAISLKGAEGYAFGIIPLLEVLECQNVLSPEEYNDAVQANGDVVITSILTPLLDRIDEILADDPAQEILDMLPNLIYFINSNGVDTVVKNTLNAVYSLLNAIDPVAKIDIYGLIGIDLATIDFDWIFDKLLDIIAKSTGYEFEALDASAIAELTVGELKSYTSINGKTAYKMVYSSSENVGSKAEMVTVVLRLLVTFIMHENNQNMLLGLLRDKLGMTADAEKYVAALLKVIADCSVETRLGMDSALATIYYIFYGADIGVGNTATGVKDMNEEWTKRLKKMRESTNKGESAAGDLIAGILDLDIFDDIIDPEEGIAPNGFIKFFQKIASWFQKIIDWFKGLFS